MFEKTKNKQKRGRGWSIFLKKKLYRRKLQLYNVYKIGHSHSDNMNVGGIFSETTPLPQTIGGFYRGQKSKKYILHLRTKSVTKFDKILTLWKLLKVFAIFLWVNDGILANFYT